MLSPPDYFNALSYGLPRSSISELQCIQNVAARLLMGTKKFDYITLCRNLYAGSLWKRIDFKVLLVCCSLHDQALEHVRDMLQEKTNV